LLTGNDYDFENFIYPVLRLRQVSLLFQLLIESEMDCPHEFYLTVILPSHKQQQQIHETRCGSNAIRAHESKGTSAS